MSAVLGKEGEMRSCVLAVAVALAVGGVAATEVVEVQPCSVQSGVVSSNVSITFSLTGNFSLCDGNTSYQVSRSPSVATQPTLALT